MRESFDFSDMTRAALGFMGGNRQLAIWGTILSFATAAGFSALAVVHPPVGWFSAAGATAVIVTGLACGTALLSFALQGRPAVPTSLELDGSRLTARLDSGQVATIDLRTTRSTIRLADCRTKPMDMRNILGGEGPLGQAAASLAAGVSSGVPPMPSLFWISHSRTPRFLGPITVAAGNALLVAAESSGLTIDSGPGNVWPIGGRTCWWTRMHRGRASLGFKASKAADWPPPTPRI